MVRRRREFNKDSRINDNKRESFKFPLDIDNSSLSNDDQDVRTPSDQPSVYNKRDSKEEKYQLTRPSVKRPTRHTILKARDIPSAIYGSKRKQPERDSKEVYGEKFKNYNSIIVSQIVKERKEKEQRQRDIKKKENQRRAQLAAEEKRRKARIQNGEISDKKTGAKKKEKERLSVLGSKEEVLRKKQLQNQSKRLGPSMSQPGISILGDYQETDYQEADKLLINRINEAFDTLGVEGKVIGYVSNGIIGRYEVKLNRSFRVANVPHLNQALKKNLGLDHLRIMSPLIGTSNIGLEVPLSEVNPITFRTLFESSSLKLRKNDFKFVLGKTVDDKIFSYELSKAGHILVYGNQTLYDTQPVDMILLSLLMNHSPHDLRISVIAEDDSYDDYLDVPHLFGHKVSPSSEHALLDVLTELNNRNVQFRRAHVRNIQSYNNRVKFESEKATMVVVIDDLQGILTNENPEVPRALIQILRQGKPLGIHVIANYKNTDQNIRYELLQLMQTKISFYDEDSDVVNSSNELTEGNDTLVVIPTSNKPNRVSIGQVSKLVRQSVFDHIKHNNR
ncbi:DNA translocase FtsK [Jeotgalicoccus meleagridis]|uniref:DNA translocase SftA n=1 Tax=Jeotgalicoccus meleagridis TaxID=2759181 RepID=A0A6V7RFT4_9STAP|nr:DNA translocase FtsK [Jeotgalicoccus meleagridis]CAD2076549.1 DNA translocase SftA [Jeotgalicoccus meleagridis]HIW38930.1 hypothetical protein [Candidatus Jeotgalicoccus stercoravium]